MTTRGHVTRGHVTRGQVWWLAFAALVALQISYPLTTGTTRAAIVVATVGWGFALSVTHATRTRGPRAGAVLLVVTACGGFAIEAIGVATGFPFGSYAYSGALGPRLLGVPLVVPLAWAWMAWPSWLVAGLLTTRIGPRIAVAGCGLAAWDLFLDPQMVAEGYWHWTFPGSATLPSVPLPGVASVPISDYLGWVGVALLMMAILAFTAGRRASLVDSGADGVMFALYLWVYASSILAHAAFLDLPDSAAWGAIGMGAVAVPLSFRLIQDRRLARERRLARA